MERHRRSPPIVRWMSGLLASVTMVVAVTGLLAFLNPRVPARFTSWLSTCLSSCRWPLCGVSGSQRSPRLAALRSSRTYSSRVGGQGTRTGDEPHAQ
jgi:hypothetical protein